MWQVSQRNNSQWGIEGYYVPKKYKDARREKCSDALANALTGAAVSRVAWMKHLDSPTVNCDVLTCNDKDEEGEG